MGPASSLELSTAVQYLKGVGPARGQALAQSGIQTVADLFYYFPRRHLDRTTITPIRELEQNTVATVVGVVEVCGLRQARRKRFYQAVLRDGTGLLNLIWFNGVKYLEKALKPGDRLAVNGKIEFFNGLQIVHPEFDLLGEDEDPVHTGAIVPLYPLTQGLRQAGIDNRAFRRLIRSAVKAVTVIPDFMPDSIRQNCRLTTLSEALRNIHFAPDVPTLQQAIGRLKFDEHFFLQLLMALRKVSIQQSGSTRALDHSGPRTPLIHQGLDFELTAAQKRVLKEIRGDLSRTRPMNRLLQGDVGSGKTVVSILAAALAVDNGVQVAVMAPTEILAHQHFQTFRQLMDRARIRCALLVGKLKSRERRQMLAALAEGRIDVVVGTHALIQSDVRFRELGLVIVDEQHRFGVEQRGELISKGYHPHLLTMTATPIPRTLAITYHGDMDLSILDELPRHRRPVVTRVVEPARLPNVYTFMAAEVAAGRQGMVVYPLVEETAKSDLAAAVETHRELSESVFPELQVGLIHGRLKKEAKDRIMEQFERNEIQILVSTTVIEVGIDIPNATVMLVEHADRFGLTQLHQLRGRVGRGSEKSYCILVRRNTTPASQQRLAIMERTSDGFVVADEDLKIRGPGEFYGTRQSGFVKYKIADMVTDGPLIRLARQAAFELVAADPHLRKPEHQEIRRRFLRDYQPMLEWVTVG